MGEIIGIREKTGPFSYRIWFTATGEERTVTLDEDKRELFTGEDITKIRPMACPFLRQSAPGRFICTVHDSRPELCRQYSCFRLLVLDLQGNRIGRVMEGTRYFTTGDSRLSELWKHEIADVHISDDDAWEKFAATILARAGYRVIR